MLSQMTRMATTSKNLPVSGIAAILPLVILAIVLVVKLIWGINTPQNHVAPRTVVQSPSDVEKSCSH